ncbi:MAG TPA: MFS transporter [Candidatus Limnocylindrales bacterium]|nr:MFS transporter [Candidatus Limnocylindrales bacterium]
MTLSLPSVRAIRAFQGWRALRHRNYRLFFGGQLISLVGTWMQSVAQSWLVLQLTGEAWVLGLVAAAQFTPVLILGLFGGLVADAAPKRRTLVATQTGAMLLAFALWLLVASGTVQVWHVVLLALGLGVVNAIDMPTRQAFSVEMVGRRDIGNAVALNSAMFNGARIIGPAVGGLAIGAFGVATAFLLNGVSFLAVIGGLLLMREEQLHSPPRIARPSTLGAVFEHLGEGLRYVRRTHVVLLATVVIGLVSTFGMNFTVLVPPLAVEVLHVDAAGYGFLMAAMGVGSLVAALAIAFSGRTGPRVIGAGALVLGLSELVLGTSHSFGLSIIAMFVGGVGAIAMAATANTVIQLTVPDQLRGRVMSVYTTVFAGSTPFGGLSMGGLASGFGAAFAMVVGGAISVVIGLGGLVWINRIRQRPSPTVTRATIEGAETASITVSRAGR